jgi:hypothetical protein
MEQHGPVSAPARVRDRDDPRLFAILASGALASGLFAAALLLPPLAPFAFVSPFPLLVLRLRGGAAPALLACLLAAGILAALFTPGHAVAFVMLLAGPGLLLSEAMARGRGLLQGCGWAFALISGQILLALVFASGPLAGLLVEPLDHLRSPEFLSGLEQGGVPAERVVEWKQQVVALRGAMAVVFPAVYVIAGALLVISNAALLRLYLVRRDPGWLEGGEFEGIRWGLALPTAFVLTGAAVALPALRPAAYNVLLILAFFCVLQGLAVVAYYAHRLAGPPLLRALVVVLVVINPWAAQILALVGLFDNFVDFRKWARAPEAGGG